MVEEVGVVALAEHLGGQEEHGGERHSHEGTALEQETDDLHGLALLPGRGLGLHALLGPGVAEQIGQDAQHRDGDHAHQHLVIVHLGAAVGQLHIAHAGQHHGGHGAEGGADGAEHRQGAALLIAGGDDLGQRAVGDVDAGIEHAEEDIAHIDPGELAAGGEAAHIRKHQHRRQGHGHGEDFDPAAIAPVLAHLGAVDDAAPDRVVDRVPDTGHDGHDHDAQDADLQYVGVILVEDALCQAEDQAGGQVAHGVAQLVLGLDAAGTGNVALFHVSFSFTVILQVMQTKDILPSPLPRVNGKG